ncbi:hypothetical protein ACFSNO_19760 [Streptomyces cirratus]
MWTCTTGTGCRRRSGTTLAVLRWSLHEHPRTLFPQTGGRRRRAGRPREGSAVNVALPAGTGDEGWLRAFHATVPELLADFRPQVLVSQHGADTHFEDPLAHLAVSLDAQRARPGGVSPAGPRVRGRPLAGSGLGEAVTRWWTSYRGLGPTWWGIAAHRPVDPASAVPEECGARCTRGPGSRGRCG